jgi:DNA-binding protein HU-beta
MNKQELVAAVSQKSGLTKKDAAAAVDAFVSVVRDALKKKDTVRLIGFGTFSVRKRAARKGRNPRTKAPINIPERWAPVFKPSSQLRELVNK